MGSSIWDGENSLCQHGRGTEGQSCSVWTVANAGGAEQVLMGPERAAAEAGSWVFLGTRGETTSTLSSSDLSHLLFLH